MWGDEAKAKIVDFLGDQADVVIRFQGGSNAGHTIYLNESKYVFHSVPSGILYPQTMCVIGSGVVVDPASILEEISLLQAQGISFENRLFIDERAGVVLPLHRILDNRNEAGATKIGTTKRGIGPAYTDITARIGIRLIDLAYPEWLSQRLVNLYARHQVELAEQELANQLKDLEGFWQQLKPYVCQTDLLLYKLYHEGKNLLFEGAQGTLLDICYGTYPFVTSSHTMAGGISTGAGVPLRFTDKIIGVYKAYCTRVGDGPFPTELLCETGNRIRQQGNEYGSTTGRPRRVGWFDAVAAKYSARINGIDRMALTLLDVLSGIEKLKICTGYWHQGVRLEGFPTHHLLLEEVQVEYLELDGWDNDLGGIKTLSKLPKAAKEYLDAIQDCLEVPIELVSVGKERSQTIVIKN